MSMLLMSWYVGMVRIHDVIELMSALSNGTKSRAFVNFS